MKRAIVTGATGFVGANLARRLLREGHEVHLLVRPGYSNWRIRDIASHVRLHQVEFTDAQGLLNIVDGIRPEWIFHLAAHGAYSTQTDLREMISTNITGTVGLVEACLHCGFEAFVNTGTSSEYGFKTHAPAETEWLDPNSHYAFTKASATQFCRYTAQSRQVHLPTLRLYSVFGPFEEPTRLMPSLIKCGLAGRLPPLVSPEIARDYIYVDDVCDAYLLAASQPGQEPGAIYNVGSGLQTTLGEVVNVARRILDIPAEPVWGSMESRIWDTSVWVANNRKICTELSWQPRTLFEAGFLSMVEWWCENSRRFEDAI